VFDVRNAELKARNAAAKRDAAAIAPAARFALDTERTRGLETISDMISSY
jgi:hypothetical protein